MAEVKTTGTPCLFEIDGTPVAAQVNLSFDSAGDSIEMSNKSTDNWKEFLAGRIDMNVSGSARIVYDDATDQLETSQKALWTAHKDRADFTLNIAITDTLSFSGTAFTTAFNGSLDDNNPADFTFSAQFKGEVTLNEGEGV